MFNKFFTRITFLSTLFLLACQSNSFTMQRGSCAATKNGSCTTTTSSTTQSNPGKLANLPEENLSQEYMSLNETFEYLTSSDKDYMFLHDRFKEMTMYNANTPASILNSANTLFMIAQLEGISNKLVLKFIVGKLIFDNPNIANESATQATPRDIAAAIVALQMIEKTRKNMSPEEFHLLLEQYKNLHFFCKKHVLDKRHRSDQSGYMPEIAYRVMSGVSVKEIWTEYLQSNKSFFGTNEIELLRCLGLNTNQMLKATGLTS